MLPDGSAYVSAIDPVRSWSEQRNLAADIRDEMRSLVAATRGMSEAPLVVRPRMILERIEDAKRAKQAKQKMKTTKWEEVSDG